MANAVITTVDEHTCRRIAVEAARDPRTVRYCIEGRRRVSSTTRAAVEGALARLGLNIAIPDAPYAEEARRTG